MPDLITHVSLGLLSGKLIPGIVKRKYVYENMFFFLIGIILPDVFSRVPMIVFPKYTPFFDVLHTVIGTFFLSYFVAMLFKCYARKKIFIFLFAGAVFHQITDLVQKDIFNSGYKLFFPLDVKINIGFIWAEDSLYAIPFLLIILLLLYRKQIFRKPFSF